MTKSLLAVPVRSLERTLKTPCLPKDTALLAKQNDQNKQIYFNHWLTKVVPTWEQNVIFNGLSNHLWVGNCARCCLGGKQALRPEPLPVAQGPSGPLVSYGTLGDLSD